MNRPASSNKSLLDRQVPPPLLPRTVEHWLRRNGSAFVVCLFLVAATLAVFGQSLAFDFLNYDDDDYILDNPHVKDGLTLAGARWAFTHVHSANWHPLTTLSHMLDCSIYGL